MRAHYKYYFEQLARKHKLIKHSEENAAFFFLRDKYNLDAFDSALRNFGGEAAMLLENYYYDGDDAQSRNYNKVLSGRFNILAKAEVGDAASTDAAQALCESIAEDILAKMREDLAEGGIITIPDVGASPKVFFLIKNIKVDFIGPINSDYYGVTAGFAIKTSLNAAVNAARWDA